MTHKNALPGVNLGGWLVLEKWMTPSLFKGTSAKNEYQLSQTSKGKQCILAHHQNFITETDIAWLAKQGVKLLRVPVGYWVFGDAPPYQSTIQQLDWLVKTAKKYKLQVLIDLHAAPEAQNNANHSGSGNRARGKKWLHSSQAQAATIAVLVRLAEHYKTVENIWGIELLNEPQRDITALRLIHFYRRAYRELAKVARPGTHIVFSDAFSPLLLTNTFAFMKHPSYPVVIDCHLYHTFGKRNKTRSIASHLRMARRRSWLLRLLATMQPVLVGEWSAMVPYKVTDEHTRALVRAQQRTYSGALAHCYWSYKTEPGGRWNFQAMVKAGHLRIPKP